MAVTAPANQTYGTVTGTFILTQLDQTDPGREPDYIPAVGTVTFKPDVPYYKNLGIPATIITSTVQAVIDSNGELRDSQGALGVVLLATDNSALSPRDWTYTVTVSASGTVYSYPILVKGGTTQDITVTSPVPSSPGVQVVVTSTDRVLAQQAAADAAASAALAATYGGGGGGGTGLTNGSVLDVHVNSTAGIQLSKTADSTSGTGRLAMTNAERTKLAADAPLNNPTFTGTVIVPTPSASGAATTKTYVDSAIATRAPLASPAFTGTPTGIVKAHVGLGNVDDTSDANKPVSTAQAAAIAVVNAKTGVSADADNALSIGSDGKVMFDDSNLLNSSDFASALASAITTGLLRGAVFGWVLEATEDETDVPSFVPISTSTNSSIIMRKKA